MSPASGLSRRDQARRGRLLVLGLAAVVVAVIVAALVLDDGSESVDADAASATSAAATEVQRTPSSAPPTSAVPATDPTTSAPGSTGPAATSAPDAAPATGCDPLAAVRSWPLRRRVALLVVVGVDPSGTGDATAVVEDHDVGGVFVGGNDTALLESGVLEQLRDGQPTGLVVAVDEEGGRVQRIEGLDGDVPSARAMAAAMSPEEVTALAQRRGEVMAAHGVDVDLAPVVDVSDQPDRTVIGDRSWSDDPATVTTYAAAYADGLLAAGIAPVLKHFPGHGSSSGDTHQGAATTPSLDQLRTRDLQPYADLLPRYGTQVAVMLGHLDVPGLTEPDTPTSLSPATVRLLRDDYGFEGVVMTDDLAGMAAVTDRMSAEEAAVQALAAGVDMVLFADVDVASLLDRLEGAVTVGDLTEDAIDASVVRTLAWKGVDPCAVAL